MRRRAVIEVEYAMENGRPITESGWFTSLLREKPAAGFKVRNVTVKEDECA